MYFHPWLRYTHDIKFKMAAVDGLFLLPVPVLITIPSILRRLTAHLHIKFHQNRATRGCNATVLCDTVLGDSAMNYCVSDFNNATEIPCQ